MLFAFECRDKERVYVWGMPWEWGNIRDLAYLLQSSVALALTPKPSGTSDIEYTTTPALTGVPSVIRAMLDLRTLLPYR